MKYFTPQGIITILVLIILVFGSSLAFSETLYVGALSHHVHKSEAIKREKHPLIIYENDDGNMVGYFRNSYDKDAFILAHHYYLVKAFNDDAPNVSVGIKAGLTTGYPAPVFAMADIQVGWIDFNFIPTKVYALSFKYDW